MYDYIKYKMGECGMTITVTDVRLTILAGDEKKRVKAVASITIDDSFVVNGVKVVNGSKGLFVAMPSNKLKDGSLRDIVHPITSEAREAISQAVIDKYEVAVEVNDSK